MPINSLLKYEQRHVPGTSKEVYKVVSTPEDLYVLMF